MSDEVKTPDVETTEEQTTDEVAKMINTAVSKAAGDAEKATTEAMTKATGAVDAFLENIAETAKAKTVKVEVAEKKASFDVDGVVKSMKEVATGNRNSVAFEINSKSDLDYLAKSTSRADLTGDVIVPDLDPEITRDPVRAVFMEQIADTSETTSDNVSWVEVITETGAPATTAELAAIPEKDFAFQEFKKPVQKIAVTNKHSVELLSDAPQLVSAIKGWLGEDLNIVTDGQLLSGNGTAPNLQGVLGVATTLDATAVGTQRIANANIFDVLRIAMTKIAVAGKGKFQPNYILLNPADVETLDLTKNADGDYIMPSFYSADGMRVRGARIIENTGVTAGTFLVGDFRKLHVRRKGGVEIEITNSDGTDFANDIITVKMRRRIGAYVRANDDGAFQTGSISDVIDALVAA